MRRLPGCDAGLRAAASPQHGIRVRRPVPRDDVERLIGLERPTKLMKQIEQPRIDGLDLVRAKVSKDVVDRLERLWLIGAVAAVRCPQALAGMRVEERQHAFDRLRASVGRESALRAGWHQRCCSSCGSETEGIGDGSCRQCSPSEFSYSVTREPVFRVDIYWTMPGVSEFKPNGPLSCSMARFCTSLGPGAPHKTEK